METRDELVSNLIDNLKYLANYNFRDEDKLRDNAENFLGRLYYAGVRNHEYTDDEKKTIISLFLLATKALKEHFSEIPGRFYQENNYSLKIQRYGFQFLYNLLKDCAAKFEDEQKRIILEETIEEIMKSEDMEELDERVENARFDCYEIYPGHDLPNPFDTD